jgi:ornithine carbamoyltransferase
LVKKNIISGDELTTQEIIDIINLALKMKRGRRKGFGKNLLYGKLLAMIFQRPSTRTRVSMEVGMYELGGKAINLSQQEIQLGRGESVEDTARTLSLYTNAIAARVTDDNFLERLSLGSKVPVINALSPNFHPLQTLADLQTLYEIKGRLKGLRIAWVGDSTNVCNSLLVMAPKVGVKVNVASPKGYEPSSFALNVAGSSVKLTTEPKIAVKDVDAIFTDSIISMGKEAEAEERLRIFLPKYQVTSELMSLAKSDAVFMHCLPAYRGKEVVREVIDGEQSVVWIEAENRLHSFKAVMCYLLLEKERFEELLKLEIGE